MSTEATEAARKWYHKTYPLTMATSSKVLCEEDIDMLAAYASTMTEENAKLRALVQAGDAMAVQLRHLAEEYRNTMSMRGGSSDIHPLHAEALTTWDAAKSNPQPITNTLGE